LETVSKLADLLKVAGNPPAFFVINKAPTQGSEGANAAEFIEKQGFTVSPSLSICGPHTAMRVMSEGCSRV